MWNLTGTELDFSSNADCVQWLIKNQEVYDCALMGLYFGYFVGCDGNDPNQLIILLESGRSNVSQQLKIIHN